MARFAVHERGSVRHADVAGRMVLGASRDCDVPLTGDGVLPRHVQVEPRRGGFVARPLAGAQLLVNDLAMPERRLRHGDRLRVGDVTLVFESPLPVERDHPRGAARGGPGRRRDAAPGERSSGSAAADDAMHDDVSQEGVSHEDVSHEDVSHEDVSHEDVSREDMARLRATLRALASETDVKRLLRLMVDEAVAFAGAERGFLVLRHADGEHEMAAARTLDGEDVQRPSLKISRAVADEVARTGVPLLTTDAQADARLRESKSVEGMRLRSVLCIPLTGRSGFLGFLYLDHRFTEGAFAESDIPPLAAFADGAAAALENARLVSELRARTAELAKSKARVEELNRMLEARVERQSAELDEVRSLLRTKSDRPLRHAYPALVGRGPAMLDALRIADHAVESSVPVLILGESGTGKELVARAVHDLGPRAKGPFVGENCAAIPETLIEGVMFGHVRGAFTGANEDRAGLFEAAHGGTLFLDEVGEIPLAMQAKLLRVLETGEVRRVGAKDVRKVDVRIVSATNRDLAAMCEEGSFREDLYYRLHVLAVRLPALRERREDIPELARHFLAEACAGGPPKRFTDEAVACLERAPWPGNVRQLRNEVLRAAAISGPVIGPESLGDDVRRRTAADPAGGAGGFVGGVGARPLREMVQEAADLVERRLVLEALLRANWKKSAAAGMLEVSRPTLDAKIRRHGIRRAAGEMED